MPRSFPALAALALVAFAAPAAHAGIALQTYTPGTTDYTATTLPLTGTMISGEGGSFPSTVGQWFTFNMPHAGSFTGITIPIHVTSRTTANATFNFGFWLGSNPTGSTVGGRTIPAADIVVGQTKEYVLEFPAGYAFGAGQAVTIDISVVGLSSFGNAIDAHLFLSSTPGVTRQKSLGVIFGTAQSVLPAIEIRDNTVPVPEPASLGVLALGGIGLLARRRQPAASGAGA